MAVLQVLELLLDWEYLLEIVLVSQR